MEASGGETATLRQSQSGQPVMRSRPSSLLGPEREPVNFNITNSNGHEFELSDSDTAESDTEGIIDFNRKHYQCSACQQVFDRLYKILAHMKLDHIESDFTAKCLQCSKVFPNDDLLAKHSRLQCLNKEKMYFCRICKIKFMWETSHEKHHQNVHANRQLATKARRGERSEGETQGEMLFLFYLQQSLL
uniref:C2H2-type domain-containing protein n=1 Tax=Phlebotomus papatasi TaxID=29031 RepID=A0A1B0D2Y4_PHLPP